MTDIQILKRYEYKGINIAIRLLGLDVIEYLFAYKGSIYTQSFDRATRGRKMTEVGAATLIVCNAAEQVVDMVLQKHSIFHKIKLRLGFGQASKVAAEPKTNPQ